MQAKTKKISYKNQTLHKITVFVHIFAAGTPGKPDSLSPDAQNPKRGKEKPKGKEKRKSNI